MYKKINTAQYISGFKLCLCLSINLISPLASAQMPSPQELFDRLGIVQQDVSRLNQGEVVLFNVDSSQETELTTGVIIYVLALPTQVSALIKKDGLASLDPRSISGEKIPLKSNIAAFKNFNFTVGGDDEAEFIMGIPSDQYNLSTEELKLINSQTSKQSDKAADIYRQILWQRWQSYRKYGLKGIAPYDRGNNTVVTPSADLQAAALEHDLATNYFPELFNAWSHYPHTALPVGVEESYTWINRLVQDRPTAILTHSFIVSDVQGELVLSRQFYAGHSFNANQLTLICLPYKKGSLIFYTNRNFTDQVSGFGSALKHIIGDKLARTHVIELLKALQKHFKFN